MNHEVMALSNQESACSPSSIHSQSVIRFFAALMRLCTALIKSMSLFTRCLQAVTCNFSISL